MYAKFKFFATLICMCYISVMRLSMLIPCLLLMACNAQRDRVSQLPDPTATTALASPTIVIMPSPSAVPQPLPQATAPTAVMATVLPSPVPATPTALVLITRQPTQTPTRQAVAPTLAPTLPPIATPTLAPEGGFRVMTDTIYSGDSTKVTRVCIDMVRNQACQLVFTNGARTALYHAGSEKWSRTHYVWLPVYETYLAPPKQIAVWDVQQGRRIDLIEVSLNPFLPPPITWSPINETLFIVANGKQPQLLALDVATGAKTATNTCPDWLLSPNLISDIFWAQLDVSRLCSNYNATTLSNIAVQRFERGVMIWTQRSDKIYILLNDARMGEAWEVNANTWFAGMPENDATIVPPTGKFQPVRGFGKIWRERFGQYGALRDALGWAIEPEQALPNANFGCDERAVITSCQFPAPSGGWYRLEFQPKRWAQTS